MSKISNSAAFMVKNSGNDRRLLRNDEQRFSVK